MPIKDLTSEQSLTLGEGNISWYLSVLFGFSALIMVLCFMFPSYLTLPDLRAIYPIELFREFISSFIIFAFLLGFISIFLAKNKIIPLFGIAAAIGAISLGGSSVAAGDTTISGLYFGLDWFILALFIFGILFSVIEWVIPLHKKQWLLRYEWFLDLQYFFINHLLAWVILLAVNSIVHNFYGFLIFQTTQSFLSELNIFIQFALIFFMWDFIQYWIHRAYHEIPGLWKFHAIHHSATKMDWLAGSRMHIVELFLTRILIITPIILIGFSESAINLYAVVLGLYATMIHSNIYVKFWALEKIFVSPKFHHWHHANQRDAINVNYAGELSILDLMFGTYLEKEEYPEAYGVSPKQWIPNTVISQTLYPFKK